MMSPSEPGELGVFKSDVKLDDQAIIEQYEGTSSEVAIDATAERALVRKLDLRILPILCLVYLTACKSHHAYRVRLPLTAAIDLDRSNIGNARTMPQSIDAVLGGDPTGALFNWISA